MKLRWWYEDESFSAFKHRSHLKKKMVSCPYFFVTLIMQDSEMDA